MIFSIPLKTPEEIVAYVKTAVEKNSPPVDVSVALENETKKIIVTLSKLGTSTIEIKTSEQEGGLYCEAEVVKLSTFHKPFLSTVETWIIDNVILASGGLLYLGSRLKCNKKPLAITVSGSLFALSVIWFFSALLYLIFKK
jgi:hypothetical protein